VHVLVGDARPELCAGDGLGQLVEREQHPGGLVVGEQAGAVQHPGVCLGRQQVVGGQAPVEVHRHRQLGQRRRGATGEAAAP